MKLENFRELLLKKSPDTSLESVIRFVHEDVLADMVIESLEKMARAKHKGDAANLALRDFGLEMDPELEPKMIHDALSHHASRYKAALRDNRKDLANDHAKEIYKIMDMADQAQKHSHGKLHVEAVSPHAWERQGKTRTFTEEDAPVQRGNKKVGQFVTDTKGWRHRGNDYSFLQGAPHESYSGEIRRHGHAGAYPMEHIRVNGKYLDIADVSPEELKGKESHIFDKHPIMEHYNKPAAKRTPEDHAKYTQSKEEFHDHPHLGSWFERHEKMQSDNPEAYSKRGSEPSSSVHAQVDPLDYDKPKAAVSAAEPGVDVNDKINQLKGKIAQIKSKTGAN